MEIKVNNRRLAGRVKVIESKSFAHRMMIAAALAQAMTGEKTEIGLTGMSQDMEATARTTEGLFAREKILDCGESGTTLRLLLPVIGALGLLPETVLTGRGRLMERPIQPLLQAMAPHGFQVEQTEGRLVCKGQLKAGHYQIAANVSSQYISGLLLALPLLQGDSRLQLVGPVESRPYIDMTLNVLDQFGISIEEKEEKEGKRGSFFIEGGQTYRSPGRMQVEGDWSNAAFWLAAGAAGGGPVTVTGLNPESVQGDRRICAILQEMGADVLESKGEITCSGNGLKGVSVDVRDIPDLVPVLAVLGAGAKGETLLYNGARLRLKESDRIVTTAALLRAIGAEVEEGEDFLRIWGKGGHLPGGVIDGAGDHRIVMSGAVAALFCDGPVTITGAEAVQKSYPDFFEERKALCQ